MVCLFPSVFRLKDEREKKKRMTSPGRPTLGLAGMLGSRRLERHLCVCVCVCVWSQPRIACLFPLVAPPGWRRALCAVPVLLLLQLRD